jgi:hypothetical protein
MMNEKGCGRKQSWYNLRYIPPFAWRIEKNHETSRSGKLVSGPRFEYRTSQIKSRSINHNIWSLSTETSPPPLKLHFTIRINPRTPPHQI